MQKNKINCYIRTTQLYYSLSIFNLSSFSIMFMHVSFSSFISSILLFNTSIAASACLLVWLRYSVSFSNPSLADILDIIRNISREIKIGSYRYVEISVKKVQKKIKAQFLNNYFINSINMLQDRSYSTLIHSLSYIHMGSTSTHFALLIIRYYNNH